MTQRPQRLPNLKQLWPVFISIFGTLWLIFEPAAFFFPQWLDWGIWGYIGLVIASFIIALLWLRPKRIITHRLSTPDTTIEIKVGDLFDEKEHLVIGANDVFDTELGDIIKPTSVQGQFLQRIYNGDVARLDEDISTALKPFESQKKHAPDKTRGKQWRYPLGIALALREGRRYYFLSAYGRMGNDLMVQSSVDYIWQSLNTLWETIRQYGHTYSVAMPIIGTDLARIKFHRKAMIQLIVLSFIAASKEKIVTSKLTIVVHPNDLASVNVAELEEFLEMACF